MTKKLFLAACIAVMALTGCKKDPQPEPTPEPTPEPQTVSRLASVVRKSVLSTGFEAKVMYCCSWENGNLIQVIDSTFLPFGNAVVTVQNLIYENGKHVRTEETNGVWQHYFTYDNDGMLKTFTDIYENDTLFSGGVTAYNAEGKVEEVVFHSSFSTKRYHFTWEDGDVVQLVRYLTSDDGQADTLTDNIVYDGKTSAYTGTPLSTCLIGNDVTFILDRISKHNVLDAGYTYNYDEKDRLVSIVKENDSTFYYYIEQTIE